MKIEIENRAGIWYVNGKRLGTDKLSEPEMEFIDNFFKEMKLKNYEV